MIGVAVNGRAVLKLRRGAYLTQRELAEMAGVSLGTLRDVEQLRHLEMRPATVRKLAAALEVELEAITYRVMIERDEFGNIRDEFGDVTMSSLPLEALQVAERAERIAKARRLARRSREARRIGGRRRRAPAQTPGD